jgi:hypothetical protein
MTNAYQLPIKVVGKSYKLLRELYLTDLRYSKRYTRSSLWQMDTKEFELYLTMPTDATFMSITPLVNANMETGYGVTKYSSFRIKDGTELARQDKLADYWDEGIVVEVYNYEFEHTIHENWCVIPYKNYVARGAVVDLLEGEGWRTVYGVVCSYETMFAGDASIQIMKYERPTPDLPREYIEMLVQKVYEKYSGFWDDEGDDDDDDEDDDED